MKEGRPFTETLTTTRFRMTTALKSLYVQIEMPPDTSQTTTSTPVLQWSIDFSGTAIPIEQSLTSMMWSDEAPALTAAGNGGNCRGGTVVATGSVPGHLRSLPAPARLHEAAPRRGRTTICNDHASKPYFTPDDVSDWSWVTITAKANPADRVPAIQPYDLPSLRATNTLSLSLPRVGFYTTPAFLALWNTNDSNQHRVTANQALLVALGQAFTAENTATPFSTAGLDGTTRWRAPNASAATRRWTRCASSGRTSSTTTTATTSSPPAATTRATRGRCRGRSSTSSPSATCAPPAEHHRPGWISRPGHRRRRAAALRDLDRAAALLLCELVALQRGRH